MKYRKLGSTGIKVSPICLGTMAIGSSQWEPWALEIDAARPIVREAVELGINYFDMADWYSSGKNEEVMGQLIAEIGNRDRFILTTKVFYPMSDDPNDQGLSRKHILRSIDRSLKRLRTDYVDIYMLHRYDENTPIEETLSALDKIIESGKARYIGASSMWAWQFCQLNERASLLDLTSFSVMQCQHNAVYRENEREMIPYCRHEGIAVTPYSPTARGFLAGDRPRGEQGKTKRAQTDRLVHQRFGTENDYAILGEIQKIALEKACTAAEIALSWVGQHPDVCSVLLGADRSGIVESSLKAISIELTSEERKRIDDLYKPKEWISD